MRKEADDYEARLDTVMRRDLGEDAMWDIKGKDDEKYV
jgi:hypothetical protein